MAIYFTPISSLFLVCSFENTDIDALRTSGAFSDRAVIRPFDRSIRSDVSSEEWICFSLYPFSLGLRYPFPKLIMQFFRITGLCFAQTMPMVWIVLIMLNRIKTLYVPDLYIEDLLIAYRLRSHGNTNFKELAPPTEVSQERINRVYQFPDCDRTFTPHLPSSSQYSSSGMSAPAKVPEVFDLDELDNYPIPIQVKKEPSKPASTSKPVPSSKPVAAPKPSPTTNPRASSSRKRKETDSPASSETFPYESHGFLESCGFMTSFLK
ncbi:hypothetical protein Hanom_Chr06g00519141 [Helianthus anomalus]